MPPFPVKGTDLCSGKACFINKRFYDRPLLRFDGPDRQFLWCLLLIKCLVQPVGTCWPFRNKQTVFFAKPLATLTEVDRSGAMLLKNHISPCQLQKNQKEIVFKVSIAKNDITFLNGGEQLPQKSLLARSLSFLGSHSIIEHSACPV